MAETKSIRDIIIKAGTIFFITIIVAIIVISFGMPDFIGSSASVDKFNVARVGDHLITKRDVSKELEFMARRMGQETIPREYLKFMESQAIDSAISRKVFYLMSKETGFFPRSGSEAKVLADYYRKSFPDDFKNGRIDFVAIDKKLRGQISRAELNLLALNDHSIAKAQEILNGISFSSEADLAAHLRLEKTTLSYRIALLDSGQKDKEVRKRIIVTEKEILEKFKKDYLSKDPKDLLTKIKRDSILTSIQNERKADAEKKWMDELKNLSGKSSLDVVAVKGGMKVVTIVQVPLTATLDSKKPKGAPSLLWLDDSPDFRLKRFQAPVGSVIGPLEGSGSVFFITVTARNIAELPAEKVLAKNHNALSDSLKNDKKTLDSLDSERNKIAQENWGAAFDANFENYKKRQTIKRFDQQKGT